MNWIETQERKELELEKRLNRPIVLEDDDFKIDEAQLLREEELEAENDSDDELVFDL